MKQVKENQNESTALAIVLGAIAAFAVSSVLSGCAVPALLGVKNYQSGNTRIEFITGVDFGFGMNGIDTVNDNRGIKPDGNGAKNF